MSNLANLMVEVVVTLANGHEGGDHMVARSVLVIERRFTQPMSERIDTECRLREEYLLADIPATTDKSAYMMNENQT